jgi:hypothetical protein
LKSYVVGSTIGEEDRKVVSTGCWIHIQRMSQEFLSVLRPIETQFGEAVFQQEDPYYTWKEVQGMTLFYLHTRNY